MEGFYLTIGLYFSKTRHQKICSIFNIYQVYIAFFITTFVHELKHLRQDNYNIMSEAKKSKGLYWIISLVSLIVMVGFLLIKPEWFWVCLPFFLTSTVLAMDIM